MADIRLRKPLDNNFQGAGLEEIYRGNLPDSAQMHNHGARAAVFRNKITAAAEHIYTDEEIDQFSLMKAYQLHPLAKRPINIRSKLAYKEIMNQIKPTNRYLLPGQIVCFEYLEPKLKEDLEYYDRTPLVVFCGITRTKDGNIREIGINLHYFPPHTRVNVLNRIYEIFKPYFNKYFNTASNKPNAIISYDQLKHIIRTNQKIGFAIKMYIPVLRGTSYLVPTRLLPTALYTEGHFSKATLQEIFKFWRQF